jgi:hypothetical protein
MEEIGLIDFARIGTNRNVGKSKLGTRYGKRKFVIRGSDGIGIDEDRTGILLCADSVSTVSRMKINA